MRTAYASDVLPITWFLVPGILYDHHMTGEARSSPGQWGSFPSWGPAGTEPECKALGCRSPAARTGRIQDFILTDWRKIDGREGDDHRRQCGRAAARFGKGTRVGDPGRRNHSRSLLL